jgi:sarcosine oxidase gamma subunit
MKKITLVFIGLIITALFLGMWQSAEAGVPAVQNTVTWWIFPVEANKVSSAGKSTMAELQPGEMLILSPWV